MVCAECNDSPLSVISSVVGIFTGVLALLAAIYVRFRLVRQAAHEIEQLRLQTEVRYSLLRARVHVIRETMFPREDTRIRGKTSPMLILCLDRLHDSIQVIAGLLARIKNEWSPQSRRRFLGIGIKYMLVRDSLKESMNEMIVWNDILNDVLEVRCVRTVGTNVCQACSLFTKTAAQHFSAHRFCHESS